MIFLKRRAFMTFKFNYETSKGIKQVILTNCGQAPFKRFSILGNSHQDSTTGKQLFKLTDNYLHAYFYHGENKEIVPYSSNAVVYLPCEPNTTYTIHGRKNINNDMTRKNRVGLTSELPAFNVKITKTAETTLDKPLTITTEEDTKYLVIMAITDGEIGKLNFDKVLENNTSKLMVEVGDKASPYEPYTGGKPSPSPDYPQQIKNVGKWNEEKQKYEVDVRVTGKNLFDKEYAKRKDAWKLPNDGYPYIPIYVGKGKRITVSTSGNPKIGLNFYCTIARTTSNTSRNIYTWIYHSTIENLIKTKATFYAIESDYIYFSLNGGVNNIEKFLSAFPDFQIEYGEERTDYEPHKEQTLTLTSDRPITKWDKLEKRDGQIGWLYKSKVYDSFDGQNNKIALANKVGNVQHFSVDFINALDGQAQANSYCDKYKGVNYSYIKEEYGIFCDWNGGVKYFSAPNDKVTNLQEFKVWLIKNPLDLAYETLETEFIPLPQSEQDAIRALTTYHPTTVITVDGGDVDAGIEVEYATKNKE